MRKLVRLGERHPKGYRVAWWDLMRGSDVAYPIGIHLIARWIHRLWELSFYYSPSRREKELAEAYERGRSDGAAMRATVSPTWGELMKAAVDCQFRLADSFDRSEEFPQ